MRWQSVSRILFRRLADDDHLSSPSIALGVKRHKLETRDWKLEAGNHFPVSSYPAPSRPEYGLAPGKDLAVSPPLFYPYGGVKPADLG